MSYAGFWNRATAVSIDAIIIAHMSGFIVSVFDMIMVIGGVDDLALPEGLSEGLIENILGIMLGWVYFASMESSSIQGTLGKMALDIKVTDIEGNKIGFGKATGRYFGKGISAIIMFYGFLMVLITPKKQGLHDMMVGSLVVNK